MKFNCRKTTMLAALCLVMMLSYSPQVLAVTGEGMSPLPNDVQQEKKITGVVSDAMGPVIGASVVVKGTSNGVATDLDGKFTLSVSPGATIVVSYTVDHIQRFCIRVDGGLTTNTNRRG